MIWVWLVIANAAMLAHFAFIGFLIGGGFWAWRRPRLIFAHVPIAFWAYGIEAWHWTCPLTEIEQWARLRAGQPGLAPTGFIDTYIQDVMYPAELNQQVLLLVASVVLISWIGWIVLAVRRRGRARRHSEPARAASPGAQSPTAAARA